MKALPLSRSVVNQQVRERNIERLHETGAVLPKLSELANPDTIDESVERALKTVDPDSPHPLNLFRVHWNNDRRTGRFRAYPDHIVLPSELTGVDAKIVVLFGDRFPMIRAHKVLAAYGCLAPRIISGEFDIQRQKAIWPSTGNYCRGGVAISRILGCRGVAILPEGMSRERFEWLEKWVSDPSDIVRTPGTESNVKEIYDACNTIGLDAKNVVFNQFAEFGNYLVHYNCTGSAVARVFEALGVSDASLQLRAFVSASGSAGTIAAGDFLKQHYGSVTVAVEALECPTLLYNGFGEHNIQGIGDKHVPWIHNVMSTDFVAGVSDRGTDSINLLFHSPEGREFLVNRRNVPRHAIDQLNSLGISSICNILAAIKTAKYFRMGPSDVIATVATDGGEMYASEAVKALARDFNGRFDGIDAATVFGQHVLGATTDNLIELTLRDRERVFNLGYFTWVEQQGYSADEFRARASAGFWRDLQEYVPAWDAMIADVNREASVSTV